MQTLDKDEICSKKVRLESKMKLRLQVEYVAVIGGLKERRANGSRFSIFVEDDQ